MKALIDGDEIAYKLSFKYQDIIYKVVHEETREVLGRFAYKQDAIEYIENETNLDIEKETIPLNIPIEDLTNSADTLVNEILTNSKSDDCLIALSGYNNFRYSLATLLPYKGDRSKDDKPFYLEKIKQFFRDTYPYHQEDFLEADDVLSSFGNIAYDKYTICSTDKDLRTVPCNNYNILTNTLQVIDPILAKYNFYTQLAIGDSTDNIPSPYNLGEKTAEKILLPLFSANVQEDRDYYQTLLPHYLEFLRRKGKDGEYKTRWYKDQDIHNILWEVGNLLWMHRTLDPNERWRIPL